MGFPTWFLAFSAVLLLTLGIFGGDQVRHWGCSPFPVTLTHGVSFWRGLSLEVWPFQENRDPWPVFLAGDPLLCRRSLQAATRGGRLQTGAGANPGSRRRFVRYLMFRDLRVLWGKTRPNSLTAVLNACVDRHVYERGCACLGWRNFCQEAKNT